MLHVLAKAEGLVVNQKKTYRIYREERLQVRRRIRQRLKDRSRVPRAPASGPNQSWSMDFMSDQLATGRRIRILSIVDDYSRECVGQIVGVSIRGQRVSRLLDRLAVERGRPEVVTVDNGPEFRGKAMGLWSQRTGVELHFIEPGKPIQNALVESFNGKFRDACLNSHWFVDLADARRSIEAWQIHYYRVRPHSALGYISPQQFRLGGKTGYGKDGRCATLENSPNFPPFPQPRRRR